MLSPKQGYVIKTKTVHLKRNKMNNTKLQNDIEKKVKNKLSPIFAKYDIDPENLESILKWKSLVLILGNFSSGKSTLINEIFEADIQRTGQSPTDDSFTVITAPDIGGDARQIPGSNLINDEKLPFSGFKDYGDQLAAHFKMKLVESPLLKDLAIIDSPGMLDAVSENDRGYDYPAVIGDLARLADLVVLMFDPHKAGTIKEVYETIRNTLPENSGEDRILFVMSRIDECDNPGDLIRSYGTLCWNLSQMTGRKDIPRIFLTFSPAVSKNAENFSYWFDERNQLKNKILNAPHLRISHILQDVDKQANELRVVAEAMANFSSKGRMLLRKTMKVGAALSFFLLFFGDVILRELSGFPSESLLSSLSSGVFKIEQLPIPLAGFFGVIILAVLWFSRWQFPRHKKSSLADIDKLIILDTDYRRHTWKKMRPAIEKLLENSGHKDLFFSHQKILQKIDRFIQNDLQNYYKKIR